MAILDKVNSVTKNIGDKVGAAVETQKLNSKIDVERSSISGVYNKIGEYYYQLYKSGKKLPEEAAALCVVIDGHNAAIEEAKAEITRINTSKEEAPPPAASSAAGGITCQSCHTANAPDRKFCQNCGAKLEAPVTPPSDGKIACSSCGAANAPGIKFCRECGAKLKSEAKTAPVEGVCPSCGKENAPGTKFCRECGAKIK